MNISRARKTLENFLAAATDPDQQIKLAVELNRLIAFEERKAGRVRRAKAKKLAAASDPAPNGPRPDDDEPFEI